MRLIRVVKPKPSAFLPESQGGLGIRPWRSNRKGSRLSPMGWGVILVDGLGTREITVQRVDSMVARGKLELVHETSRLHSVVRVYRYINGKPQPRPPRPELERERGANGRYLGLNREDREI